MEAIVGIKNKVKQIEFVFQWLEIEQGNKTLLHEVHNIFHKGNIAACRKKRARQEIWKKNLSRYTNSHRMQSSISKMPFEICGCDEGTAFVKDFGYIELKYRTGKKYRKGNVINL